MAFRGLTSSPYRAVNTLPLGYKNQSVNAVEGNNRQNVELLNVKLTVHIVTTVRYI